MTEEERQKHMAAFDIEANASRSGWVRLGRPGPEIWEKKFAAGIVGRVEQVATAWAFYTCEGGRPEAVIDSGVSSRRGWAMDGCEDCVASRIQ